jgi:hypothetical protein
MDDLILPLSIVLAVVSYSLIAKWYVLPWLAPLSRKEALTPLLLLHTFRFIGMAFLIPGVTSVPMCPTFADGKQRIGCAGCGFLPRYSTLCHFRELVKTSKYSVFKRCLDLP